MSTEVQELPKHALDRLSGLRAEGDSKGVFTSDLSVNEYLLVREAGFEPIGLVMGSSVYQIGVQRTSWKKNMEMEVLTQAMYEARELAMERMEQEAKELGADGIVGVKLQVKNAGWGTHVAEFVAIGTAVVAKDKSKNYKANDDKPFTSDLSGQDFWTLLQAGYRPYSLVMGTCVYHVAYQSMSKSFSNMGKNVELTHFTQALYDARELAMERMQQEAHRDGAEGIVGVRVTEGSYGWESHVIEFFAVGTSIVAMSDEHHIKTPELVLSLNK